MSSVRKKISRLLNDAGLKQEDSNVNNLTENIKHKQTQCKSILYLNKGSIYSSYVNNDVSCKKNNIKVEVKLGDIAKSAILSSQIPGTV